MFGVSPGEEGSVELGRDGIRLRSDRWTPCLRSNPPTSTIDPTDKQPL